MEIQHFSHDHTLRYGVALIKACIGCGDLLIAGYSCAICKGSSSMNFGLHKSCAELPRELHQHPLHPSHPLTLLPRPPNYAKFSICDECRNLIVFGFLFHCFECNFSLDVKCAYSPEENEGKKKEIAGKALVIDHFSDYHPLTLANCPKIFGFICGGCGACQLPLSGPAYCCLGCEFFLHESCLDMPQEIPHPFHPEHLLLPIQMKGGNCNACRSDIKGLIFNCAECKFKLHFHCASSPTLPLRHKRHPHNLFYFSTTDDISRYSKYFSTTFSCEVCGKPGKGSFYRCVECNSEFHFQCLPIPPTVRHERHVHPLTLRRWFIEDDFGQYYCDFCETERNPEHPVYCCVDCKFAAHIECIVSEEELPSENDSSLTGEFEEVNYSKDQKKISMELKSLSEPEDAELDSEENGGSPENPALVELDAEITTVESELTSLKTQLDGLIAKVNAITDKEVNNSDLQD